MWKILGPLILLVIALLFQLQVRESFTTSAATKDASGNIIDSSGNTLDSSGNIVASSGKTLPTTSISLTLSDLLKLFKAATPVATTAPSVPSSSMNLTPSEFYNELRPQLIQDIKGITTTQMIGSPYQPSAPLPCDSPISDSAAQGAELQNVMKDYIKRDEIPCYGCTL